MIAKVRNQTLDSFAGLGVVIHDTLAEYEALTDAEKMDGNVHLVLEEEPISANVVAYTDGETVKDALDDLMESYKEYKVGHVTHSTLNSFVVDFCNSHKGAGFCGCQFYIGNSSITGLPEDDTNWRYATGELRFSYIGSTGLGDGVCVLYSLDATAIAVIKIDDSNFSGNWRVTSYTGNKYRAGVAITSALYEVPADGYAILNSAQLTTGKMGLDVIDPNGTDHGLLNHSITDRYQTYSVFVRKGMKIRLNSTTSSGVAANFCALVS